MGSALRPASVIREHQMHQLIQRIGVKITNPLLVETNSDLTL